MKNLKTTFLVQLFSLFSFAQVGIGTNTPVAGAILELKSADKALLLTRVAKTADVTTPVNGMMVYDISSNCIKGYQNGAWTGCLSACGSNGVGGSLLNYPCNVKFSQISFVLESGESYWETWGVTQDKKVYAWGRNIYSSITNGVTANPSYSSGTIYSPSHVNYAGFEGKAVKVSTCGNSVAVLTDDNKIYAHGSTTYPGWYGSSKFSEIITGYNGANYNLFPQSPAGFGWKDMELSHFRFYLIDTNGNAYWSGMAAINGTNTAVTSLSNIPHPLGKKFVKIKVGKQGYNLYLIDIDGDVWASGDNDVGQLGVGNTTNRNINSLAKVQFSPTLTQKVVDVIYGTTNRPTVAVLEDGSAYVWSNTSKLNNVLAPANVGTALTVAVPLSLPPGATKFINFGFGSQQISALTDSGVFTINSGLNWQLKTDTTGFVAMFEETSSSNFGISNFGGHLLLDANGYVYAYGDNIGFFAFGLTSIYPANCIANSFVSYAYPIRLLNGNYEFSVPRYCTNPIKYAPFPEP